MLAEEVVAVLEDEAEGNKDQVELLLIVRMTMRLRPRTTNASLIPR